MKNVSLLASQTMRSSLSMGGRIAVAAKESTSPALGLQLMISFKLFKAALWRMYLPLVAVQPGLLHVAGMSSTRLAAVTGHQASYIIEESAARRFAKPAS